MRELTKQKIKQLLNHQETGLKERNTIRKHISRLIPVLSRELINYLVLELDVTRDIVKEDIKFYELLNKYSRKDFEDSNDKNLPTILHKMNMLSVYINSINNAEERLK